MGKRWILPALVVLAALTWSDRTLRAQPEKIAPEIAEDISGIHQALDRLVGLLERAESNQHVELLIKRIELQERRLAPAQARLRSAEAEVDGLSDEITQLQSMQPRLEEELDEEIRSGVDPANSVARRMKDELDQALVGMENRLEIVVLRVRGHEDRVAEGRETIAILDDLLLELLDKE
jgi:hypothetical protein